MKPSILSRFKPLIHFFEVKPAWLYHSYETPEADKLEMVLVEKDDKIGINFYRRWGIHPSEKEATGEAFVQLEETEKAYINQLDAVAQKTGVAKTDIAQLLDTDINAINLIEEAIKGALDKEDGEEDKNVESIKKMNDVLKEIKQSNKEEVRENIKELDLYLPELNGLRRDWTTAKNDYYLSLELVFLNTARCVSNEQENTSPNFTLENIKNLHQGLQAALFTDFIWQEINQWQGEEAESNNGSEGTEKN